MSSLNIYPGSNGLNWRDLHFHWVSSKVHVTWCAGKLAHQLSAKEQKKPLFVPRSGLNVCVPPKFTHWKPWAQVMVLVGGDFGRWPGPEGGDLMNGITVLIIDSTELPRPSTMWGHGEVCGPGEGPPQPFWPLISDLQPDIHFFC